MTEPLLDSLRRETLFNEPGCAEMPERMEPVARPAGIVGQPELELEGIPAAIHLVGMRFDLAEPIWEAKISRTLRAGPTPFPQCVDDHRRHGNCSVASG